VGGKTGLYQVGFPIKEATRKGYKMAYPGDSIDLAYPQMNTRRGRVISPPSGGLEKCSFSEKIQFCAHLLFHVGKPMDT